MKIYARQVDPKYQQSPFNIDNLPDSIAIYGNEDRPEHLPPAFKRIVDALNNPSFCPTTKQDIEKWLPPESEVSSYTDNNIDWFKTLLGWYRIFQYYISIADERVREHYYELRASAIKGILSIVTGKCWKNKLIADLGKSNWNDVYYVADEWNDESLNRLSREYFNTGTEWIISGGNFNPRSVYITSYGEDNMQQEIADIIGASPIDIVLQLFEGRSEDGDAWYREWRD